MFKVLVFLLVSFSVLLSNSIGKDNYFILLEKNRIESLNSSAKFSINTSNNDFSWHNDNLDIRNSQFLNTIEENSLTNRQKEILIHLERNLTRDIVANGNEMTCENIVTNSFNTIGITRSECINLEIKIKNYYESSYCRIGIPLNGLLNEINNGRENYKRLEFKETRDIKAISSNLKKIARLNREIETSIKDMSENTLRAYCNKIIDDETTMFSKSSISQAIVNRAAQIGSSADDIRAKCSGYDFSSRQETCGVYLTTPLSNDLIALLNQIIADTTNQIGIVNTKITNKQNDIAAKVTEINLVPGCNVPPPLVTSYPCVLHQSEYSQLNTDLTNLQSELALLQNSLTEYNGILATVTPGTTVVGILAYLDRRSIKENLHDLIGGINWLDYYINHYILNHALSPSVNDLRAKYDQVDSSSWPKEFGGNSDITFTVDMANFTVTYDNLGISMQADKAYIRELYTNHLSLKQKAIIDSSNMSMTIPMDPKTVEFIKRVNSIPTNDTILGTRADNLCSLANDLHTLYEPDGRGFFNHFFCNWTGTASWVDLGTFTQEESEIRVNDDIFLKGKKFYEYQSAPVDRMFRNIIIDDTGNFSRIKR